MSAREGPLRRRFTNIAIFLLLLGSPSLGWPPLAHADLQWLDEAKDCQSFSSGIKQVFGAVENFSKMTDRQKGELSVVLHEACGQRFSHCNFSVCKSYRGGSLDWLNQELSCKDFLGQMRQRYSKLGKYSALPEEKKVEVGYVLNVACSSRFAECEFKRCKRTSPARVAAAATKPPEAIEENQSVRKDIAKQIVRQMQRAAEQAATIPTETPAVVSIPTAPPEDVKPPSSEEVAEPTNDAQTTPKQVAAKQNTAESTPEQVEDPEAKVDRLRERPEIKLWAEEIEMEAERNYSKLLAEEYSKRRALMELSIRRETKDGAEWERVSNPAELEVVSERRQRSRSQRGGRKAKPNAPNTNTGYRPPQFDGSKSVNTPGSSATTIRPSKPVRRRPTSQGSMAPIVY